jgi:DNA-binding IclR family transcriptional regulator
LKEGSLSQQDIEKAAHQSSSSALRSLRLLECLSRAGEGLTLTELARRSYSPKSTALKLLRTLQQESFVLYNRRSKRYLLGPSATNLARSILDSPGLRTLCRPYLEDLARISTETAYVGVEEGDHIIYIDKVEGSQSIRLDIALGTKRPLHSSAVGKLFLAYTQEDFLESRIHRIGLPAITPNTLTDPEALLAELTRIRRDGISISQGENIEGITAIAAPVWDEAGQVVAGISVSGPSSWLNDDLPSLIALVKNTAKSISEDLLWTGALDHPASNHTLRVFW